MSNPHHRSRFSIAFGRFLGGMGEALGIRQGRYLTEQQAQRRKKRLIWTGVAIGAIGLAAYPAYRLTLRQIYRSRIQTAQQARAEGLVAMEKGDWPKAIEKLRFCIRYRPTDAEAFKQLYRAYRQVPGAEAMWNRLKVLSRYVELRPDDVDASRDLLEQFVAVGMATEALDFSAKLLEKYPNDYAAMHVRVQAFKALRRWEDALRVAQKRNLLRPDDVFGQMEAMYLRSQVGFKPSDLVREARESLDKSPRDSGKQLLLSIALQAAGDLAEARKWAVSATSQPSTRPLDLALLVRHLDSLDLFEETLSLVKGMSGLRDNREVQSLVLRRLWEAQDLPRMLDLSADLNPATDSPASLFFRAVALMGTGQGPKAKGIMDALLKRTDIGSAQTLGQVIDLMLQSNPEPLKMVRAVEAALRADPRNAILHDLLGSAYARLGEKEMALEAYSVAAMVAPAWSHPLQRKAQLLLETGYTGEATQAAIGAVARQKSSAEALAVLVRSWTAQVQKQQTALSGEALGILRDINDRLGDREQLFPAYLASLALAGESAKATAELDHYLSTTRPKAGDELLLLAGLSAYHKLGRDSVILETYQKSYGITPPLGLTQSLLTRIASDDATSIATFNRLKEKSKVPAAEWDTPYAQLLEALGSPDAPKAWKDLLARHPDDIGLIKTVLGVPSLRTDKVFLGETIERLRKLTGDSAIAWRLAQARLTLAWNPDEKTMSEIMLSLTNLLKRNPRMTEARVLLAQYLERSGNVQGAVEQLRMVISERSDLASLRLKVAQILMQRAQIDEARDELRALLATRDADPGSKRSAAIALGQLGDWQGGAAALEAIARLQKTSAADSDLARMLLRADRPQEALQMARELAKSNDPSSIELLADTLLATGNRDKAKIVLDRLDQTAMAEPLRSLAKANLLLRHGDPLGMAILDGICQKFPQDRRAWEANVYWALRTGNVQTSRAACERALAFLPGDATLLRFKASLGAVAKIESERSYREVASLLLQPGARAETAAAMLDLFASLLDRSAPVRETLAKLREYVAREEDPVTILAVARAHQQLEDVRSADQILSQGRQKFPLDGSLSQAHARLLLQLRRFPEAVAAAEEWRKTDMARINPDLVRCRAYLGLGQVRQAQNALQPYWKDGSAKPDPTQMPDLSEAVAQVLATLGRWDEIRAWLAPQLGTSPRARSAWMGVAASVRTPPDQSRKMLMDAALSTPGDDAEANRLLLSLWLTLHARTGLKTDLQAGELPYGRLVKTSADEPVFLLLSSEYHRAAGRLDQACTDLERVLKVEPTNWAAMNNLAYIMATMGKDLGRAKSLIEAAAAANPFQINMQDTLAMVYQKLSRWQEAADILETLIKADTEHAAWRVRRAYCLTQAGKLADAKREMTLLPPGFADLPTTEADDKALYEQVRKQLR